MPVSALRFADAFRDEQDHGIDVLGTRLKGAERTYTELRAIYEKRAQIERDYGQQMLELSQFALGEHEQGTLGASLERVPLAFEATARAHLDMADQLTHTLNAPLASFMKDQTEVIVARSQQVDQSRELKNVHLAHVQKMQDAQREAMANLEQKKQANEDTQIAQTSMALAEQQLQSTTETLDEVMHKFQADWQSTCDIFQDLEERRINFIRSNLWAFANMMSSVYIVDDRGCESIRTGLEKTSVSKDIQHLIRQFGTSADLLEQTYPSPTSATSPHMPDPVSTAFEELESMLARGANASTIATTTIPAVATSPPHSVKSHRSSMAVVPTTFSDSSQQPTHPHRHSMGTSPTASIDASSPPSSVHTAEKRKSIASSIASATMIDAAAAIAANSPKSVASDVPAAISTVQSPPPPAHTLPTNHVVEPTPQQPYFNASNAPNNASSASLVIEPPVRHPTPTSTQQQQQQQQQQPSASTTFHGISSSVHMVEPPSYPPSQQHQHRPSDATQAGSQQPFHWNVPNGAQSSYTPATGYQQQQVNNSQKRAPKPREEKWTFSSKRAPSGQQSQKPTTNNHIPPSSSSSSLSSQSTGTQQRSSYLDHSVHPPPLGNTDNPAKQAYRNSYYGNGAPPVAMDVQPPIQHVQNQQNQQNQRPVSSYHPLRNNNNNNDPNSGTKKPPAITTSASSSTSSLHQQQVQGIRPPAWQDAQHQPPLPADAEHASMSEFMQANDASKPSQGDVASSRSGLQRYGSVSGPRQPPSNGQFLSSDDMKQPQPYNQDTMEQINQDHPTLEPSAPPADEINDINDTTNVAAAAANNKGFFSSFFKRPDNKSPTNDDDNQCLPDGTEYHHKARALWAYDAVIDSELTFQANDVLAIIEKQKDGWWKAEIMDNQRRARGLVPGNYMQPV
ncbi:hypothetical protein BC940DRAFT_347285 [Gongronella butleri]|nr:hypothetical protein BC940DRAFT_347285 [Gongronella butleri]